MLYLEQEKISISPVFFLPSVEIIYFDTRALNIIYVAIFTGLLGYCWCLFIIVSTANPVQTRTSQLMQALPSGVALTHAPHILVALLFHVEA